MKTTVEKKDLKFMRRAIKLATKALNNASPNPQVGCVLVEKGKIVAEGYHKKYGSAHAEATVLKKAGKKAKGADLYTILEPCCHYGKTPPCTKAIIEAGVKRVFVGIEDPNPKVNRKGVAELRKAGLDVVIGVAKEEVKALNLPYLKKVYEKKPFVILKLATSINGKISYGDGKRKIISGPESRAFSYNLRNRVDAILVGAKTAIKDNPKLWPKSLRGKKPLRVVLDSRLRISEKANLLGEGAVIFYNKKKAPPSKIRRLSSKANLIPVRESKGKLSLNEILKHLNKLGVNVLLVEGGSEVFTSFMAADLYDLVLLFVSRKKIVKGKSAFTDLKKKLSVVSVSELGNDFLFELI